MRSLSRAGWGATGRGGQTGNVLVRGLAAGAVLALILWAALAFWPSEERELNAKIDAARDALVAGKDEEFLSFFAPAVLYRGDGDFDRLKADVARWRKASVRSLAILDRQVVIEDGQAEVRLDVAVGGALLNAPRVTVNLWAKRRPAGWSVDRFDWEFRDR